MKHFRLALTLEIVTVALVCAGTVGATTFTVTKTADTNDGTCDGDCSLREAIIAANVNAGLDSVDVPAGTYTLDLIGAGENAAATGDLDITDDAVLQGAGPGATFIDGNASDRVLHIFSDIAAEISGITIRNGFLSGSESGGGISSATGTTLGLTNCTVSGNTAAGTGGGILAYDLTITHSTVSGNTAGSTGGGILAYGLATITSSTVSGNTAGVVGGIYAATITLTNSTVSGNTAVHAGGLRIIGESTLINATVTGNVADGGLGGGIYHSPLPGFYPAITNSIVAENSPTNCTLNLDSLGHNLDDDGTCGLTEPSDLSNVSDAGLGPLQDNGGPTQTHALLAGSPAIDAGDDSVCPATDQRGVPRPRGPACDIGAYESEYESERLDAFKCYKAKDLKDLKFEAQIAGLTDQFVVNDGDFEVKKPFLLCNPTDKNGEGINNLHDHLTCYKIKGPKLDSALRPQVEVTDQFGTLQLEATKPFLLCVPSAKAVLP